MAEQQRVGARFGRAHGASPSRGARPRADARRAPPPPRRPRPVDQHAAPGLGRGDGAKAVADAGEETPRPAARSDPPRRRGRRSRASDGRHRHIQHQREIRAQAHHRRSAPRSPRGRRPGHSPDRPWWNRRSGRRPPRCRRPAPGGWCARHARRGRRNAAASRPAATRRSSPSQQQLAEQLGPRRAARLARAQHRHGRAPRSASASSRAWVDLPAPSPPSSVMKRPRASGMQLPGHVCAQHRHRAARQARAAARRRRPAAASSHRGTPAPVTVSLPSVRAAQRPARGSARRRSTVILALLRQLRGIVTTRSRAATSGTVGAVPSQTGACSTVSPAVNSVTSSNSRNAQSSSRSPSSARWCMRASCRSAPG